VAKNIGQAGKPVLLRGSATPGQYESCPERRHSAQSHYLALVCDAGQLTRRLRARPGWRKCSDVQTTERMLAFNQWLVDNAVQTDRPMTLLDTTHSSVEDTVQEVVGWVRSRL